MRAKPKSTRAKPEVAFSNQEVALRNIAAKRDLLLSVLKRASEHRLTGAALVEAVGKLPTSVRQFNRWTGEALPTLWNPSLTVCKRNANDTLRSSGMLISVQRAIEMVTLADRVPPAETKRTERIAKLQRDLKLANTLREIAERELIRVKQLLLAAAEEKRYLESTRFAAEREGSRLAALLPDGGSRTAAKGTVVPIKARGKKSSAKE